MATKVFISYRHVSPDRDLAQAIHQRLVASGIDSFIDTEIAPGADWEKEIGSNLRAADYFVVLLSPESVASDMVQYEVAEAHKQNHTTILPVRFETLKEPTYTIGAYLRKTQYIAWNPVDPYRGVCDRLLDLIRSGKPVAEASEQIGDTLQATDLGDESVAMPSADPRIVMESGAVRLNSPFYVRRAADATLESELLLEGRTIIISGARQTGKSSLLARAHAAAVKGGHRSWFLDFQTLTDTDLQDLKFLLSRLAQRLEGDLDTNLKAEDVWRDKDDAKYNLDRFIERAVLRPAKGQPVFFCFDEIDRIFARPFKDDFFAGVRAWHNSRATNPAWTNLTLVLTHSTDPSLWIDKLDQSPFNVADQKIRLGDFGSPEVDALNRSYGSPLRTASDREGLRRLVGGQPYLVRQSLYTLKKEGLGIEALSHRLFEDHLRHLLISLQRNPEMLQETRRVLAGDGCREGIAFEWLRSLGVVTGDTPRQALIRCELYEHYLREHLP